MALQRIEEELEGLALLNRELVNHIYDRVVGVDARIRCSIMVMQESGIPKEVCNVFEVTYYKEVCQPLFQGICKAITEAHIPAIRNYIEDLFRQYGYVTGTSIDVGQFLTYPDPSQSANVATPLTVRNTKVNDYALQCVAICDFADFLVDETENLDIMLTDYKNLRCRLLDNGVPTQICYHYEYTYAQSLEGAINYNLRKSLTEAYKYLVKMYDQIVASMNKIGLSVDRVPHKLAAAGYGGDVPVDFTTTSNNVAQKPKESEKEYNASQSREQNVKDLEKIFGKPDPEIKLNIAKADKQNANPHYYEGDEYSVNCATCALTYVLRYCFGFDVKAKGNNKSSESLNYWLSMNDNSFKVWKNADGSTPQPSYMVDWMNQNGKKRMTSADYREYFEESCKEKGVYVLLLSWQRGGGHATILERDEDGKLYRIEPQIYDECVSDEYGRRQIDGFVNDLAQNPPSCDGILKVDDKVFDTEEQSFFLYDGVYRMIKPLPLKQVHDDYHNIMGKVVKRRFTDLIEI